jgi:hypothetical protein
VTTVITIQQIGSTFTVVSITQQQRQTVPV